jgi:hypothetical protein
MKINWTDGTRTGDGSTVEKKVSDKKIIKRTFKKEVKKKEKMNMNIKRNRKKEK